MGDPFLSREWALLLTVNSVGFVAALSIPRFIAAVYLGFIIAFLLYGHDELTHGNRREKES